MRQIVAILTIMVMTMMAAMVVIIIGSVQQSEELVDYANALQETKTTLKKQTAEAITWQSQAKEYELLLKSAEEDNLSLSLQLTDALSVVDEMASQQMSDAVPVIAPSQEVQEEGQATVLQTSLANLESQNARMKEKQETLQVDYDQLLEAHHDLQETLESTPQTFVSIDTEPLLELAKKAGHYVLAHWPKETTVQSEVYEKQATFAPVVTPEME